jgi:hypothetical protein
MDEDMAARILAEHVNKLVTAKIVPLTAMISGLEFAIFHLFNLLDRQGVLTREAALASLSLTREALPEETPPEVAMIFDHLERCLRTVIDEPVEPPEGPEHLRSRFQLLQGGLSETPPTDTDRSE